MVEQQRGRDHVARDSCLRGSSQAGAISGYFNRHQYFSKLIRNLWTVLKNDRHDAVLDHLAELNVAQGLEAWAAHLSRRFSAIESMVISMM